MKIRSCIGTQPDDVTGVTVIVPVVNPFGIVAVTLPPTGLLKVIPFVAVQL